MWFEALQRAMTVANSVDSARLADADYRQRVIEMLRCDTPAVPSVLSRLTAWLSRHRPRAA